MTRTGIASHLGQHRLNVIAKTPGGCGLEVLTFTVAGSMALERTGNGRLPVTLGKGEMSLSTIATLGFDTVKVTCGVSSS